MPIQQRALQLSIDDIQLEVNVGVETGARFGDQDDYDYECEVSDYGLSLSGRCAMLLRQGNCCVKGGYT
ncbi:MAG: hypothetical protein EZS28_006538 [Streblomastix strix]|uniref:Uncharacterized protein n=1 Tax=Streblomastix strix TaxID=222440 RepID=A0A5J4WUS6_9EUKA|nr:MAG: hypothetical protein EZS28_006538 [Streblomastix strix]